MRSHMPIPKKKKKSDKIIEKREALELEIHK
jgi:hypothetical protein